MKRSKIRVESLYLYHFKAEIWDLLCITNFRHWATENAQMMQEKSLYTLRVSINKYSLIIGSEWTSEHIPTQEVTATCIHFLIHSWRVFVTFYIHADCSHCQEYFLLYIMYSNSSLLHYLLENSQLIVPTDVLSRSKYKTIFKKCKNNVFLITTDKKLVCIQTYLRPCIELDHDILLCYCVALDTLTCPCVELDTHTRPCVALDTLTCPCVELDTHTRPCTERKFALDLQPKTKSIYN